MHHMCLIKVIVQQHILLVIVVPMLSLYQQLQDVNVKLDLKAIHISHVRLPQQRVQLANIYRLMEHVKHAQQVITA